MKAGIFSTVLGVAKEEVISMIEVLDANWMQWSTNEEDPKTRTERSGGIKCDRFDPASACLRGYSPRGARKTS